MQKLIVNRANKSTGISRKRTPAHTRIHTGETSSLTSYLGNANTVLCYAALYVTAVLWFTEKDNRPSRSLWRHYPVRLESIFSTRCGNDCAGPGRPAGRRVARPSLQRGKTTPRLIDGDYRFGT